MLRTILIILIIIVIIKIYITYNQNNTSVKENFDYNINNPFVDGLSQAQLGANVPDQGSILDYDTLPDLYSNNVINKLQLEQLQKNKLDNSSRINQNINLIDQMLK